MDLRDKLASLKDIFGARDIRIETDRLVVDDKSYPVVDEVIILLEPEQYPDPLKKRIEMVQAGRPNKPDGFAEDIQFSFGEEWQKFPKILPEHEEGFRQYFDLVQLATLRDARMCDLGCGMGRWSYFLTDKCRELVLVDFSEAIFVARRNLAHAKNALFFMGDLRKLPFRNQFSNFLFSLGVLHHLPIPALDEVRALRRYAPRLLIYLYYALDNRPFYFRMMLALVTAVRSTTARIRNPMFRAAFTWVVALGVYLPLILAGAALRPLGLAQYIPLYEGYHEKGRMHIRQDVYDRFFTRIEQRHTREQILGLRDTFSKIKVSDQLPYWHFICES